MSVETRLNPALLLTLSVLSATANAAEEQVVYNRGSQPSFTGAEEYFTGQVQVDMVFPADKTPYSGAYVTFSPTARTAWHSHPAGQHMIVTKGTAITATREGQVIAFHEGETVWCPENVDHWHGTTADSSMTHFVITGSRNGDAVHWKDKVTDAQYQAALNALTTASPSFDALSERHQQLAWVAATAASSDQMSLESALNQALDSGLTMNELKESLLHLYPYGGFPKSLNALGVMMKVTDERRMTGKKDKAGEAPSPLPQDNEALKLGTQVQTALVGHEVTGPLFDFAPAANTFLQKHLFGDVFARGILSHQDREILTLAILATMADAGPQLRSHIAMAMNTGITRPELEALASVLGHRITHSSGQRLAAAINDVTGH